TLGSKKRREGKFPIKEKEKENFQSKEKGSKEIPNQRVGESEKKRKKKKREKKKERKLLIKDRKKTEEMCRKVFGPDNI
ncbi:hypothetical protein DD599_26510, partial [Enterobacter cloacae complex sp. CH23B]